VAKANATNVTGTVSMDRDTLERLILARLDAARQWATPVAGTRTRCAIVEDLLPAEVARSIYDAFPADAQGFRTLKTFREHKRQAFDLSNMPPILAEITYALQSPAVVARIGALFGIPELDGDPTLYAGGLSMMFKGQFLNPHIDNSHEATRTKYRRINTLYYVTPDWREANGGNLELWDTGVTTPHTIFSKFNRLVFMETNRESWHSVSPVVEEGARCCVSNYYFSQSSPDGDDYYHVTSYTGRPGQRGRRVLGQVDNALRQIARRHLGLTRSADKGYEAVPRPTDSPEA
jgi:Rps23 Pro-64 3,4-dihydroxylase Tpa1-like proline 4-hydroxylase